MLIERLRKLNYYIYRYCSDIKIKSISAVRSEINSELQLVNDKSHNHLKSYYKFYNYDNPKSSFFINSIIHDNKKIVIYYFIQKENIQKEQSDKNIIFLHGYFDHTGNQNRLINFLINLGYNVLSVDLPGHGLSEGERASIQSFDGYQEVLKKVLDSIPDKYKKSLSSISHSTGSSIIYQYLYENENIFNKIIFVAPLFHSYHWHSSKFIYEKFKKFLNHLPRRFSKDTSDKEFIKFRKYKDPIKSSITPMDWVRAYMKWSVEIENYRDLNDQIYVLQGASDRTLDWKYNLNFIRRKVPNAYIFELVKNAGHQLLNEGGKKGEEAYRIIKEVLEINTV